MTKRPSPKKSSKKSKTVLSPVFSTPEKERLFAECASRSMKSKKAL